MQDFMTAIQNKDEKQINLLIRIRLEENIVKEKESNNSFQCLIPY